MRRPRSPHAPRPPLDPAGHAGSATAATEIHALSNVLRSERFGLHFVAAPPCRCSDGDRPGDPNMREALSAPTTPRPIQNGHCPRHPRGRRRYLRRRLCVWVACRRQNCRSAHSGLPSPNEILTTRCSMSSLNSRAKKAPDPMGVSGGAWLTGSSIRRGARRSEAMSVGTLTYEFSNSKTGMVLCRVCPRTSSHFGAKESGLGGVSTPSAMTSRPVMRHDDTSER